MFFSCTELPDENNDNGNDNGDDGNDPVGSTELVLLASDMIIHANGEDAVEFTVLSNGEPVTENVRFYDGSSKQIELPDMKFTTTEPGTYSFWAAYGTSHTDIVTITAIGFPVPELPEDPEPENTSFARRVLLTQFTGTGCGYCPGMIELLRSVMADEDYSSSNSNDPAFYSGGLDMALGVMGYPMVIADMSLSFNNYNDEAGLKNTIDAAYDSSPAKAGISARAELDGNTLVVITSVKAAETSVFRIGAWLLEDGIEGRQTNNNAASWTGDYNTHDNCIRVADSRLSNTNFTGHSLGTIEAGETAEYAFVINIEEGWVAVSCDINGEVTYQYSE